MHPARQQRMIVGEQRADFGQRSEPAIGGGKMHGDQSGVEQR